MPIPDVRGFQVHRSDEQVTVGEEQMLRGQSQNHQHPGHFPRLREETRARSKIEIHRDLHSKHPTDPYSLVILSTTAVPHFSAPVNQSWTCASPDPKPVATRVFEKAEKIQF